MNFENETGVKTLTITADAQFKYKVRVRAAELNMSVSKYIKMLVDEEITNAKNKKE